MLKTFKLSGFAPVTAHTKSEARALLKAQLEAEQELSFQSRKIRRLEIGAKVREILGVPQNVVAPKS